MNGLRGSSAGNGNSNLNGPGTDRSGIKIDHPKPGEIRVQPNHWAFLI